MPRKLRPTTPFFDSDERYQKVVAPWARAAAETGMSVVQFLELTKYLELPGLDESKKVALYKAYRELGPKNNVYIKETLASFIRDQHALGLSREEMKALARDRGIEFKDSSFDTTYTVYRRSVGQAQVKVSEVIRSAVARGLTKQELIDELNSMEVPYNPKSVTELFSAIKAGYR